MITRHKVYGLIFLAASFLVLSPTCSFAGSNDITTHTNCHPTISGLVTRCADASPITGVIVTYSTGSVTTDDNGTYEITDASEGWYVMKFEKPCYTTRSVLGVWRCGKSYERNLCLENSDQADMDGDGISDACDNCPDIPNGQDNGTCVKAVGSIVMTTEVTCTDNSTCQTGEYCQMEQGDINENGAGDACECYADFNDNGKIDGGDMYILIYEATWRNCDPDSETSPPCCYADANGNGRIDGGDMFIMVTEANAGRRNCPIVPHCPNVP